MLFWLGTHETHWLSLTSMPLFVSRRRLSRIKRKLPRARGPWALDSGGFSELDRTGQWSITARQYVAEVRCWSEEIGNLCWAAAQDWMCEPFITTKTGLAVRTHQLHTVANYLELLDRAPELPWIPVLQGYHQAEYLRHVEDYTRAGVDLHALPFVGVGSICRRQATAQAEAIIHALAGLGLKLHGFGFKLQGLRHTGQVLTSADSMAWSVDARRAPPLPNHTHKNCANCLEYALRWREKVQQIIN
jgi:hypothetical protein